MSARYTYATTIDIGDDELDVEVTYSVTWGAPETPPTYAHGGLPADPDEIDDLRLRSIDGVGGPFDQEVEAAILQQIAMNHFGEMLSEASDHEHQMEWADSDDRDDY
jgi:hypothetical protein